MKIAFTGHRDRITDVRNLDFLMSKYPDAVWVHGGALGFDSQVSAYAENHGISQIVMKPDYSRYSGKQAPIMRNLEIVATCDLLVACYDGRTSGGTYFTIEKAKKAGKPITYWPARQTSS